MRALQIASFTGVILAGGASRRMGRDKALLRIGETTMLDHMSGLLAEAGASNIVVLGRGDRPDAIPDEHPLQGPAIALQRFLADQIKGSRHIVVPVDMPAIRPQHLVRLSAKRGWAYFGDCPLPCLAIAGKNSQQEISSMRDLLLANRAQALDCLPQDQPLFFNVNTPDAYRQCKTLMRGMKSGAWMGEVG